MKKIVLGLLAIVCLFSLKAQENELFKKLRQLERKAGFKR